MRHFGHSTQWRTRGAMAHARYDRFSNEPSPKSDAPHHNELLGGGMDACGHGSHGIGRLRTWLLLSVTTCRLPSENV